MGRRLGMVDLLGVAPRDEVGAVAVPPQQLIQ